MKDLQKWFVLIGTGIAAIIISIDHTIVYSALSSIQNDINASMMDLQWIIAGFGLVFCSFLVTAGRFGDIHGRRKVFYIGIIGFALASLGAGVATSAKFLIVMRIFQGLFGSPIFPCGMAIAAEAFAPEERGKALGIYCSISGIGLAFGPVLGSLIINYLDWRWIFFVNIPFVLLSMLICYPTIKESKVRSAIHVDWLGVLSLISFLGALVFYINEGQYYGWISPKMISVILIAMLALALFIRIEKNSLNPLIPTNLFMNYNFLLALIIYVSSVSFSWPIMFIMPLYLNNILNLPISKAGIVLSAITAMAALGPIISGYLYDKHNKVFVIRMIYLFSAIAFVLFSHLDEHGPLLLILISFFAFGLAWGMGNGISSPMALSHLPNNINAGLVSGALITLMNIFAVLALSIGTSLLHYFQLQALISHLHTAQLNITENAYLQILNITVNPEKASSALATLSTGMQKQVLLWSHQAFAIGLHRVCYFLLICLLLLWIFAEKVMKKINL